MPIRWKDEKGERGVMSRQVANVREVSTWAIAACVVDVSVFIESPETGHKCLLGPQSTVQMHSHPLLMSKEILLWDKVRNSSPRVCLLWIASGSYAERTCFLPLRYLLPVPSSIDDTTLPLSRRLAEQSSRSRQMLARSVQTRPSQLCLVPAYQSTQSPSFLTHSTQ